MDVRRIFSLLLFATLQASVLPFSAPAETKPVPYSRFVEAFRTSDQSAEIKVYPQREKGEVPFLYRSGMFVESFDTGYPMGKFFRDLPPGLMEFSWDFLPGLRMAGSLDQFLQALPGSPLTAWIREVERNGGESVIRLMPTPKWLWRNKDSSDTHLEPPVDWGQWADFVAALVGFYNNRLGIPVQYVVWDEPDGFWKGTEDDYFQLYKHSVIGAKRANRGAKVGGPATVAWDTVFDKTKGKEGQPPILYNFIRFCSRNPVPELGLPRLPIDFINWHAFNQDPLLDSSYKIPVLKVRQWLKEFGYDENIPFVVGSWNSELMPGKFETSQDRDTHLLASFSAASLIAMQEAGIARHNYFCLFEDWQLGDPKKDAYILETYGDSGFFGGYGIFTPRKVVKPVFNAFKAAGWLKGRETESLSADPFLKVVSARDQGKMFILIANFIPSGHLVYEWIDKTMADFKSAFSGAFSEKEIKDFQGQLSVLNAQAERIRSSKEKGNFPETIDSLSISRDLKDFLKTEYRIGTAVIKRQSTGIEAMVTIHGLPGSGAFTLERYPIDAAHGNGSAVKEKIRSRYAQLPEELKRQALSGLSRVGMGKQEFERYQRMDPADKQRWVAALPKEQKDFFLDTFPRVAAGLVESTTDSINEMPEVGLHPVQTEVLRPAENTNLLQTRFWVEPYSLNLLVISPAK